MRTRLLMPLLVLSLVAIAAACSVDNSDNDREGTSSTTAASSKSGPEGREFVSTSVAPSDGTKPVAATPVRIRFDDGAIGVDGGCNSMSGPYTLDGDTLVVRTLAQTEMACAEALMARDQWLAALITGRPTLTIDGDRMTLDGSTGRIELADAATVEPDTGLTDTTWVLDTVVSGDTASSVPKGVVSTITFTNDGTALLDTGCNRGQATYEVDGDTISFGPAGITRMACRKPAAGVESAYLAAIAGDATFVIDGGRLTITGADGGLGFAANGPAEGGTATPGRPAAP